MAQSAWNKTTGIRANRVFSYSNDPEMKLPETHEKWLAARRIGVGGSDIAAVAGVNPFKSAIDVFLEKTGRMVTQENQKMRWGKLLENPIAAEYSVSENVAVHKINAMLQHPEHKVAVVNLDRLVVKNGHELNGDKSVVHNHLLNKGNGSLEIKTTSWAKAWAESEIPDFYYTQLQWQLGITGLEWGQFAVLISGQDFIKPTICEFNQKVFHNLLLLADKFWTQNVLKDRAPDPDQNPRTLDSMKLLYPEVYEETINLSESLNDAIKRRGELVGAIKTATAQKAALDSKVLSEMRNAKYGMTSKYKVTRILRSGQRFNTKKFKESNPELHARFSTSSESIYPMYKELTEGQKDTW